MYRIGKTWTFAAAHHLPSLPGTHKCRRPHGHNYTVTVEVNALRLDAHGFVVDYAVLDEWWSRIKDRVDHHDLNEILGDAVPSTTAENIASYLYRDARAWFAGVVPSLIVRRVRVSETGSTFSEWEEE